MPPAHLRTRILDATQRDNVVALPLRARRPWQGIAAVAACAAIGLGIWGTTQHNSLTHEQASSFAHAVAQALEKHHGDRVVSIMRKDLRGGKVFIDWSQNSRHKTTVCVYSLRARPHPTVSTPVTWDEVESGALDFDHADVVSRIDKHGDLFAPVLTLVQSLPG